MFKDKLKELREKEGLSQQELADKLFVSRSAVAKWENGNGIPSDVNLDAICNLFEVSKNELFEEGIINEFRDEKNRKNKYKKSLIILIALSSIVIVLLCSFYFIQQKKYELEYERFKETMRENLNEPVQSFGNVEQLYLDVINSKILQNDDNVFLNEKYFYVVDSTTSQDIVKISRYNYEFKEIGVFQLFLHNGYNAEIVDIKTSNNNSVLIVCKHYTYFNNYKAYNGYSTITKLDENYNTMWEYTFIDFEHDIYALYEHNDKYYVFSTISELDDVSVAMTDVKISVLTLDGKIEKEEYVTKDKFGSILAVNFIDEIFYIGCFVHEEYDVICKTFEYDTNLKCINSYNDDKFLDLNDYKSSNGVIYYERESLEINNIPISDKYGRLVLSLNIEDKKLLVFKNAIDYDWDFHEKNPYISHIPKISQTVYLYIDNAGNILWCKAE